MHAVYIIYGSLQGSSMEITGLVEFTCCNEVGRSATWCMLSILLVVIILQQIIDRKLTFPVHYCVFQTECCRRVQHHCNSIENVIIYHD